MKCSVIQTQKGKKFFYELIGTKVLKFFSSVKQIVFCRFYQNRLLSRSSFVFSGTEKKTINTFSGDLLTKEGTREMVPFCMHCNIFWLCDQLILNSGHLTKEGTSLAVNKRPSLQFG